jgi:hypothetical protein
MQWLQKHTLLLERIMEHQHAAHLKEPNMKVLSALKIKFWF